MPIQNLRLSPCRDTGPRRRALLSSLLPLLLLLLPCFSAPAHAFDFDDVAQRARLLAQKPYQKREEKLPTTLQNLGAQKYRDIRMKGERVLWRGAKLPFEVELLSPGDMFATPVKIHEISSQGVREFKYDPELFDYPEPGADTRALAQAKLGFSGLRIRAAGGNNGSKGGAEDLLQFQGASYMRGQVRGNSRGLAHGSFARGLALDTALNSGEKFPQFVEFWLERPSPGDRDLGVMALLDSPDATGAYRFVVRPGSDAVVEVKAQLYLRKAPEKLGIAPLTGMFFFGENQPHPPDDYRPEVHGADGLSIQGGDGEWIWRPLSNPKRLLVTAFALDNPLGFGLLQRDRQFSNYEDLGMRYEQRPNVWVEPLGKWGTGHVELVQIPSPSEWNDNIVAFWTPDELQGQPRLKGRPLLFEYRLSWSREARRPPTAWVTQTRWGHGYRARPDTNVGLIVDFEGPALKGLDANSPVDVVASCDGNGKILSSRAYYNEASGGWRVELQVLRYDP
ncbi:MAG TPA: glucan biosynthesis protein G, partial [Rhodocyclaceae bacterium]|nr:glucan biosynthesis protein G [Rhodocyclaceae bacterium]